VEHRPADQGGRRVSGHVPHPEVCFYALNGRTPLEESKRTPAGLRRRVDLLAEEFPDARELCEAAIDRYTTPSYAPSVGGADDIVDAVAAAVTARRGPDGWSTLPETPPADQPVAAGVILSAIVA
jgi:predicted RNase H-like nuclease